MIIFKLSFLLLGAVLVNGRSIRELVEYERFLRQSVHGKYEEALTPELEKLQNPEERSGKFEGDIILTSDQINSLLKADDAKNAILNSARYWPNNIVYYAIQESDFTAEQIAAIERGIKEIEDTSCLTFQKRTTQSNYVRVLGQVAGCYSSVGMVGGAQVLNLTPNTPGVGCFRHGTIVHEFLHAIGFYHMQSTHDRDDYVRIVWDKIQEGSQHNFNKYTSSQVTNFDVDYDFGSVLHYSEYGFSIDGSKTIEPLVETDEVIGQRVGMSQKDIRRLNLMYKCIQQ